MPPLLIRSDSPSQTGKFGEALAVSLVAGDLVTITGPLGSGKSVFARAIIRTLAGDPELEVPSPTFTLCQLYQLETPVAHYDLYRIGEEAELEELGLEEAIEQGIALVEWPERITDLKATRRIEITITGSGDQRSIEVSAPSEFTSLLSRSLLTSDFLRNAGLGHARRQLLGGDASSRSYERIVTEKSSLLLMDAPRQPDGPPILNGKPYSQIAHLAEDISAFVAVDRALIDRGLRAPEIRAFDLDHGLILLEDLGEAGIVDAEGNAIEARYLRAMEFLCEVHRQPWPSVLPVNETADHELPFYDAQAIAIEVSLLLEWYLPRQIGRPATPGETERFHTLWAEYSQMISDFEQTLVLRDFHSPNVLWQSEAEGIEQVAVIDFQDALLGPSAYDVASLAQDARISVPHDLEERLVAHYIACRIKQEPGFDAEEFKTTYAIMAAQRATKILGIFVRLDERDGKPGYLVHLPQIRDYLDRSLRHPAMAPYKQFLADVIPQ